LISFSALLLSERAFSSTKSQKGANFWHKSERAKVNSTQATADFRFFVARPKQRAVKHIHIERRGKYTQQKHMVWKSATFYLYYSLDFYFTIL
jgi:hypothetical protein